MSLQRVLFVVIPSLILVAFLLLGKDDELFSKKTTNGSSSSLRIRRKLALFPQTVVQKITIPDDHQRFLPSNNNMQNLLSQSQGKFKFEDYRNKWAILLSQIRDDGNKVPMMKRGAEVGVFKGDFSKEVLREVKSLEEYILVDPWRHLDGWNKPFNKGDDEFSEIFNEAMAVTRDDKEYGHKVSVVRKTGLQAAKEDIEDESLDFLYIDGDHTAKGTLKDILAWYPKIKCGGLLMGDDYMDGQQHDQTFDPTMVKSIVDGFAETIGVKVYNMGAKNWAFVKPYH